MAAIGPPGDVSAPLGEVFYDAFDREQLGPYWHATSPAWRLKGGRLCVRGARNHPVWLKRKLPTNARIEFDATSSSPDGDIKAEAWGDGRSAAQGTSYTQASSYLAILGGWKNRLHVLARLNEHGSDRLKVKVDAAGDDLRARPVEPHRPYHFKIERNDGKTVQWLVDDIELFSFSDPRPLRGTGHEHFAFNNWEVRLCFDNLVITPLEGD